MQRLVTLACAGALVMPSTTASAPEAPLPSVQGVITAIDWQIGRLTVQPADGRTQVLLVHPEATWVQIGNDAWKHFHDLKVGMTADVIYRTDGCQPRVILIVCEDNFQ
jgi:hypothetical protein